MGLFLWGDADQRGGRLEWEVEGGTGVCVCERGGGGFVDSWILLDGGEGQMEVVSGHVGGV